MKRGIFLIFACFCLSFHIYAKSGNDTQIISAGSWVYEDLNTLASEAGYALFIEHQPMSVGELKQYLYQINYMSLSENGQFLFEKIEDELFNIQDLFPHHDYRFLFEIKLNPELYFKTNENIDWTLNRYLEGYAAEFPILFGFSDYVTIQSDMFIGKNYPSIHEADNYTNIPFSGSQMELNFPRFSYGSTGLYFDNWGVNFHVGKEGFSNGITQLGSIVYNDTFETDFYAQLDFYTNRLKYLMTVSEIEPNRYLYLHELDLRPAKRFRLGIIEGSLLNSSFELRYLNPFMIMHSFGSWYDYEDNMSPLEYELYGEGHFCAYLALTFDWMIFSNFRFYGLYAQNEILDLGGSRSDSALSVPDSLGGQLGIEYNFYLPDNDYLKLNLEAVYTSPYLYVKQSPEWSLYRSRDDIQFGTPVTTWLGSPFGPDCFAVQLYSKFKSSDKFSVSIGYLFKLHGENDLSEYKKVYVSDYKTTDSEGNVTDYGSGEVYTYYPSVKYALAQTEEDRQKAKEEGRNMWMSGNIEYTHQVAIKGSYSMFDYLSFTAQIVYNLVFNNDNIIGNTQQGVELSVGGSLTIF